MILLEYVYFANARMYDPEVERFYGVDPLWMNPSPYAYAGNSPLMVIDPTGMYELPMVIDEVHGVIFYLNGQSVEMNPGDIPGLAVSDQTVVFGQDFATWDNTSTEGTDGSSSQFASGNITFIGGADSDASSGYSPDLEGPHTIEENWTTIQVSDSYYKTVYTGPDLGCWFDWGDYSSGSNGWSNTNDLFGFNTLAGGASAFGQAVNSYGTRFTNSGSYVNVSGSRGNVLAGTRYKITNPEILKHTKIGLSNTMLDAWGNNLCWNICSRNNNPVCS